MISSSIEDARQFLSVKRIAVVGVSRNERDFSRGVVRALVERGYDVVPVNPALAAAEGLRAFPRVRDVAPPPEAALLLVPPARAEEAVRDCLIARVKRIWFHRGAGAGSASEAALALCRANGIAVVAGLCPFMALPGTSFPHRLHGLVRRAFSAHRATAR
ncbi:MAG TPA: CoA-binding protein [Anaeromyxobacter sp.]